MPCIDILVGAGNVWGMVLRLHVNCTLKTTILQVDIEYDGTKLRADATERDQAGQKPCNSLRDLKVDH